MVAEQVSGTAALDALHAQMAALQLEGLWRLGDEVQAAEPRPVARPYVWRGAAVRRVLERAGELVQHDAPAEHQPETQPADSSLRRYGPALRPVRPTPPTPLPLRQGGGPALSVPGADL